MKAMFDGVLLEAAYNGDLATSRRCSHTALMRRRLKGGRTRCIGRRRKATARPSTRC